MDKSQIISELMSHYKFKKYSEFADFLEVKPQVLSNWVSRKTFDIEIVYTKCVDINPDWLLSGKGEMLRNSNQNSQLVATEKENEDITFLKQHIRLLNKQFEEIKGDEKKFSMYDMIEFLYNEMKKRSILDDLEELERLVKEKKTEQKSTGK